MTIQIPKIQVFEKMFKRLYLKKKYKSYKNLQATFCFLKNLKYYLRYFKIAKNNYVFTLFKQFFKKYLMFCKKKKKTAFRF